MTANFLYSSRDHKFILKEWLDMSRVFSTEHFQDTYSLDDVDAILDYAFKAAKEVVAPSNTDGDNLHARFENGRVSVPASMKKAYSLIQENGFGSSNKNHHDESALPLSILGCVTEYLSAANPALGPYYAITSGAVDLIQSFGDARIKSIYLDKMFSGRWAGTMDLTEPGGGSDVGDILTRAYPTDEPGIYRIKGTKCFITGGEQDITENIVHLTLARIEGAAPGTKGISLFVVPKYWPDPNGEIGEFNDVHCLGLENKMGMRGSATCVMSFGEEDRCRGCLLGDPVGADGIGQGMSQMFHMMNEERLGTGHAAMAAATAAFNQAAHYAAQRIQGRPLTNPRSGRVAIIQHEDIRRMLMFQKAYTDALRAMTIYTYYLLDVAAWSNDPELVQKSRGIIEISTPVVKAFASDMAFQCISEAMQVLGGYGFSEEYPIARMLRDSRVYCIWEGTNYIQALDLVGRKWTLSKGKVFAAWLQDIQAFITTHASHSAFEREFHLLQTALNHYREIQMTMASYAGSGKIAAIGVYATRILHATGKLYCGKLLLDMALIAQQKMDELGPAHYDYPFYHGKVASARFFLKNIVPEIETVLRVVKEGDTSVIDVLESALLVD